MRIAFLLGAGVSIPAGMPCTRALTDAVLRMEDYTLHTDGSFVRDAPHFLGAWRWKKTQPVLKSLLKAINNHCQTYFEAEKKLRVVNYEDLFFAASQLEEHLSQEYENPAIEPFTKAVLTQVQSVQNRQELSELVSMICNYIRDVVAIELSTPPTSIDHLTCLVEALRDQDFEGCDIFTLNHDLLIEEVLEEMNLPFVDGFGAPEGPEKHVAWWKPEVFNQNARHYVLKLHGSVNWVEYDGRLGKALSFDRDHAVSEARMLGIPDRSRVLVGTFNKIRDYFGTPYFDLQATFRRQMASIGCLIVSGYSFGDKGVNAVLSEWMRRSTQSKLLVLHADGDQCLQRARGAIRNLWERCGGTRMFTHSSHLNNCNWPALRRQHQIW